METEVAIHRIRITLTSRNVKSLEKGMYIQTKFATNKHFVSNEDKLFFVINRDDFIRYSEPNMNSFLSINIYWQLWSNTIFQSLH